MQVFRGYALRSLLLGLLLAFPAQGFALAPGDMAPDFTLLDTNNVAHSLSDYLGQVVLLSLAGHS